MNPRVAVIGLGKIGTPMAGHLHLAGFLAAAYDPHEIRRRQFGDLAVQTPAEAAAAAEIIIIPLATGVTDPVADRTEAPTSDYMERILLGPQGVLSGVKPGTLVIDMTTGDPRRTRRLEPAVRSAGCELMDAPISGAEPRAKNATLSIIAAGSEAGFARALPVFQKLGTEIRHVGPLGTGHTIKLLQNLVACLNTAALAEVTALAERAGVGRETFLAVVNAGVGVSHISRAKADRIIHRTYDESVDQVYYQAEVLRLALGIAEEKEGYRELARAADDLFQLAGRAGLWEADQAALVEAITPGRG